MTAFHVDHRPIEPAFGYRVDFAGRSVAVSGDTRFSENLIQHAKGVDLLIHEAIDPVEVRARLSKMAATQAEIDNIVAHHITAEEAGVVFARVKPRLAVYAHISDADLITPARKSYSGPLEAGEDLMVIDKSAEPAVELVPTGEIQAHHHSLSIFPELAAPDERIAGNCLRRLDDWPWAEVAPPLNACATVPGSCSPTSTAAVDRHLKRDGLTPAHRDLSTGSLAAASEMRTEDPQFERSPRTEDHNAPDKLTASFGGHPSLVAG